MARETFSYSTKRIYLSCLIGLGITEILLYGIIGLLFLDPLGSKPELFAAIAGFAVLLAMTIRWLSAKFTITHEGKAIVCASPLPWARRREIGLAGAKAGVESDIMDRALGTASVCISRNGKMERIGPLEYGDAKRLAKAAGGK
ncbi:MAG: hypothetical protein WC506_02365 [Candidatus Micrarchaeia archaeon]